MANDAPSQSTEAAWRIVTTCHECEGRLLLLGDPPYMGANRYGKWVHVEEDGTVSERTTEIDRTDHDASPVDDGHKVAARPEPPVEGALEEAREAVIDAVRPYRDGVEGVVQVIAHEAALDAFETDIERERRFSYEAAQAAVAFGEANPNEDELDLASYSQGYRAALAAARSGHDGLREALEERDAAWREAVTRSFNPIAAEQVAELARALAPEA